MTDCIFCKIIKGEIPAKFVYQDELMVGFYDISPKAPVHVLVMPKKHLESLRSVNDGEKDLMGEVILTVHNVAKKLGIDKGGYKVVINNGEGAGQLVFHLHLHLLGGWNKSPGWQV
ncbi:histidine triad nucleotide-binding protein [Candidatus Gottesmanbacteria bacterium]|nr:histidine triad nucleotide-binding protein [Candidatus Gottesmanbacteria bacterium]